MSLPEPATSSGHLGLLHRYSCYPWSLLPKVQTTALTTSVQSVLAAHDFHDAKSRALIFVSTNALGYMISQALGFDFYCGGDLTPPQRIQYHNRWITTEKRVMVCTSAFGVGNDYPHTRLVIHAGSPFEMIGYIQEVSRAGRDKQSASSEVLIQLVRIIIKPKSKYLGWRKAGFVLVIIKAGTGRTGRTRFVRLGLRRLGSGLESTRGLKISRAVNIHARN